MMKNGQDNPSDEPNWIELAKIAQKSFFNRRALEWRLAFGFWTAIAAFSAAFFTPGDWKPPAGFSCQLAGVYVVIFVASIFLWHLPIQKAHGGDKRFFLAYLRRARNIECEIEDRSGSWSDVHKTWFFAHLIFNGFFLALSWYAITRVASQ